MTGGSNETLHIFVFPFVRRYFLFPFGCPPPPTFLLFIQSLIIFGKFQANRFKSRAQDEVGVGGRSTDIKPSCRLSREEMNARALRCCGLRRKLFKEDTDRTKRREGEGKKKNLREPPPILCSR